MVTKTAKLGKICVQDRITVRSGERNDLKYIGLESIESNTGDFINGQLSKTPEAPQANSFLFNPQHVLYGKLRPYLNKVALPDFEGKCSTEIIPLLPKADLDRAYLAYFLRSPDIVRQISERTAGARMPRADMDHLFSLTIPLPPLPEQRRLVDILSRAEGIVRLRREAQKKVQELIPALFPDMFGDPATNPKGWPIMPLLDVAEIISGVTKGRKLNFDESISLPYIRVANVQDGHLNLAEIKYIAVRPNEIEKYHLEPGDLLMTEGGDSDKLGRAALWNGEIEHCLHQNHIFKVRANRKLVFPEYLRALTGSEYGKRYFLQVAKRTTGIASINKTQLGGFPVVVPPLIQQIEFSDCVIQARSIQSQQFLALEKVEATFQSLLHRAFAGEL